MFFSNQSNSMRKCKHQFKSSYRAYRRKSKKLSPAVREQFVTIFDQLNTAIREKNSSECRILAEKLKTLTDLHLRKSVFDHIKDLFFALLFALVIAVIVRQMWFEPYEIPSGSMRPTFREQDRLVVSKTQFGLNIPLTTKHLIFDPDSVKRGGIVIFTGENMDIEDVNTTYFYLFPGKKQYIKRLIAKPGDKLYFYGGLLYGVDQEGNDITSDLNPLLLKDIDHVPFITFEGKVSFPSAPKPGVYSSALFTQMNMPIAELTAYAADRINGRVLYSQDIQDYGDLFGYKNYAITRLIKKESLPAEESLNIGSADYYLEITHDPSLKGARIYKDMYGRIRPHLKLFKSYIPLAAPHLKALSEALYTARFVVKDGKARRYEHGNALGHKTSFPLVLK